MTRLTMVISSLRGGGAARQMTILANGWANRATEVTLITLDMETPSYALDSRVCHRALGVAGISSNTLTAVWNNLRRIRALRRAILESRPEAIVSFADATNVLTLLAACGLGRPVVVFEVSDPAVCPIGIAFGALRRWLYPHADAVVVQSEEAGRFFSASIQTRAEVIPNPVVPARDLRQQGSAPPFSEKTVMSLGRLAREKGFDLLIEAFARVALEQPEWSLEIWGEGPDRVRLETLVLKSGLRERARLPGWTDSPELQLRRAGLFVLSSRFEGFPNALCEAMACGLPVLAVDCPSGPRQIIRHGVDGILVPADDPVALGEGMRDLMGDPEKRCRLASRAPEIVERFGLPRVLGLWDAALARAARRHRH